MPDRGNSEHPDGGAFVDNAAKQVCRQHPLGEQQDRRPMLEGVAAMLDPLDQVAEQTIRPLGFSGGDDVADLRHPLEPVQMFALGSDSVDVGLRMLPTHRGGKRRKRLGRAAVGWADEEYVGACPPEDLSSCLLY